MTAVDSKYQPPCTILRQGGINLNKKDDRRQLYEAFSLAGSIGLSMVATILVGLFGGRLMDNWLGTGPWFTLVGILLGMVSGFWATYKQVTDVERDK
jgi:ATP synthase protein I